MGKGLTCIIGYEIIGTQVSIVGKGLTCKSQGSNPANHPSSYFFPHRGGGGGGGGGGRRESKRRGGLWWELKNYG